MKKCICFARVSTTQQDLTAQLEAVINAAKGDGYTEDDIIKVQGKESAINLKEEERQTLNELKDLVNEFKTIETIYFFAVDRLARRMSVIMSVKEWADDNKLNLVFLNPHRMQTLRKDNGVWIEDELTTLLLSMLAYGAQMEMKTKKARFKTVKDSMRAQGKLAEGRVPLGYKLDANKYVIPDEGGSADTIRNIFNDYLTGEYSITKLHDKYVKKGVFEVTTMVATQKRRIYAILTNPAYCGERVGSKQKNPKTGKKYESSIQYPAIITKELFEATQEMLHAKKKGVKGESKHIYYAKGIVKCHCGHSMIPKSSTVRYQCESYGHSFSISLNVIDSITWLHAQGWYTYYSFLDFELHKGSYAKQIKDYEDEIKMLEEKLKIETDNQDRAFRMYVRRKVSESAYEEIVNEISKNINTINAKIVEKKSSIQQLTTLYESMEMKGFIKPSELKDLNDIDKVDVIKKTIKEIRCTVFTDDDNIQKVKIELIPVDMIKQFALVDRFYYKYWVTGGKIHLTRMHFVERGMHYGKELNNEWYEYTDTGWIVQKRFERTDKKNKAVE